MPDYRLYRMDPHSGHINGVEEFHSGDDVEAILLVQNRPRRAPAELWCGARKVLRLDATPAAAAAPVRARANGRAASRATPAPVARPVPDLPQAATGQQNATADSEAA